MFNQKSPEFDLKSPGSVSVIIATALSFTNVGHVLYPKRPTFYPISSNLDSSKRAQHSNTKRPIL